MVLCMPIYLYWGDDDFAINKAVAALRQRILAPDWANFNYDKLSSEQSDAVIQALNLAMTPPFGAGGRLVWLADTTVCQQCSPELLAELERTLPVIPQECVLLLTCRNKPDGRLKSTKLLQYHAEIREFSLIPPWKTDLLLTKVQESAAEVGVKLSPAALELLAESVGNDTRQLFAELEKLQLFAGNREQALTEAEVEALISCSSQSSLQLAAAIRKGDVTTALGLVADLLARNQPALRIVATLTGQFRTWLWVKLMMEEGQRDEIALAKAADIPNPKRIYFLRQEVSTLPLSKLLAIMPLLLELEVSLKQGADELTTLQTQIVKMCQILL